MLKLRQLGPGPVMQATNGFAFREQGYDHGNDGYYIETLEVYKVICIQSLY